MSAFLNILIASFSVSVIAFFGVVLLVLKSEAARRLSLYFLSFAAGALLGVTFLDILPEVFETGLENAFSFVLSGIVIFFILEKFFLWYHCHGETCEVHRQQSAPLILFGDAIHNFVDGVIIALAFLVDVNLGILTTVAVIFHEIPQEIGDFSILLYGGMKKSKALILNFLVALTVVAGAALTYFFGDFFKGASEILLAFVAGHFIYIAAADLIPELHKETSTKKSFIQIALIFSGIAAIWAAGRVFPH
ncbi:MAG: ZIP family metal transporter [Patescibacteria group bacterium]